MASGEFGELDQIKIFLHNLVWSIGEIISDRSKRAARFDAGLALALPSKVSLSGSIPSPLHTKIPFGTTGIVARGK